MAARRDVLYYPFHLCSEETLTELLRVFDVVHFRDYMAFQLTPFLGTTAFQDRMGDTFPHLLSGGRLVQGYQTSGPIDEAMEMAVNRDLADLPWRESFHRSFTEHRRFQRGLFGSMHGMAIGGAIVPGPAALLQLMEPARAAHVFTIESVRNLSNAQHSLSESYTFEYGLALIKTALAGRWTVRIAQAHNLSGATDSIAHYHLLERTCDREGIDLTHHIIHL